MQREKGSLISKACPGCQTKLALVSQSDGSTAYERCSSCFPATTPEPKARAPRHTETAALMAKDKPARELGTKENS
jgi:hypothetical protein